MTKVPFIVCTFLCRHQNLEYCQIWDKAVILRFLAIVFVKSNLQLC